MEEVPVGRSEGRILMVWVDVAEVVVVRCFSNG